MDSGEPKEACILDGAQIAQELRKGERKVEREGNNRKRARYKV